MSKKFKEILENIGKDVLTEESKEAVLEAFSSAVNEKVESRMKLEVETAQKQLDENHAEKLKELLEAIDVDHVNKLKKVIMKVDEDYAEKLSQVIEKYEHMIEKEAIEFREKLVTEMSNFMELYMEQMIPKEQLEEAVKNTKNGKLVQSIRKIVSVDDDFINENIKEALQDGKEKMDELQKELTEAVKTNIKINQDLKKTKASLILEKKTADLDDNKKKWVLRVLQEKSPEEIEENFEYVIEMFEKDEAEAKEVITEVAKKEVKSKVIDTPKAEEVKEPVELVSEDTDGVTGYLDVLKEQDHI